jgi:carotenoid cleavage dioxygenase-like enzyme
MSHRKGFESLDDVHDARPLEVRGEVPEWLRGTLIRTGPAKFEVGDQAYRHWFDGLAMLHAFDMGDGEVSYANQYLQSDSYRSATEEGRIVKSEFGTDPCRSIFQRAMSLFSGGDATDNANVNVARMAGEFVAMTETPMPITFDVDTLETGGHLEYAGDVDGDLTTAHPHTSADGGTLYNYTTAFGRTSAYRVYSQGAETNRRELLAEVTVDEPRYMHSFAMTEHSIVLVEFPLVLYPLQLLFSDESVSELLTWEPERGTRFTVIDRESGEVRGQGVTEPFFAFHHINAWEEDSAIWMDMAAYPDAEPVEKLYLENLRSDDPGLVAGRLRRFRLDAGGEEVSCVHQSDHSLELPRTNYERVNGRPYQYVWGNGQSEGAPFLDEIVKIDVHDDGAERWRESGCFPGEPVFVERPEPDGEDDGVLLSVVLDAERGRSFLLVLDAVDLSEIARGEVDHHIPFHFHGMFEGGGGCR